jgi:hypothetical protein
MKKSKGLRRVLQGGMLVALMDSGRFVKDKYENANNFGGN